ncbi:hypothetical protein Btru_032417 [Bulinus truncatus]|nr:hypothetical protein Btru_032417 [Bulinus truncatus]
MVRRSDGQDGHIVRWSRCSRLSDGKIVKMVRRSHCQTVIWSDGHIVRRSDGHDGQTVRLSDGQIVKRSRWSHGHMVMMVRLSDGQTSAFDDIEDLTVLKELDAEPTMDELSKAIDALNSGKSPGLIVRSSDDISLYLHLDLGDSMIVFPIDALGRDYEISRMAGEDMYGSTAALLIFTPFNNTSISVTPMKEVYSNASSATTAAPSTPSSTSPTPPSSTLSPTNILLDAFEIRHYYVDRWRRYRLHSNDVFGVILLQSVDTLLPNDTLCRDVNLSLFDFVPPYSVRGRQFYIALPNTTDLSIYIHGQPNTTVDITTDVSSLEVHLDQLGSNISVIRKTASAWLSATQAVSVYVRAAMCNGSFPCYDSGFYLPSVEHYYTCEGNKTQEGCLCTCPTFFDQSIDPASFHFLHNSSDSLPTSIYPLMVGALFDVTTTIKSAFDDVDNRYVIVTTNTSFLIFRHDLMNLNFLPSGSLLPHSRCSQAFRYALFLNCEEVEAPDTTLSSHYSVSSQCVCEFLEKPSDPITVERIGPAPVAASSGTKTGPIEYWEDESEDTTRPLIAVVVSLCVAIFAVIALISGYMLVEMTSRRKHVRNPKIRPFVS